MLQTIAYDDMLDNGTVVSYTFASESTAALAKFAETLKQYDFSVNFFQTLPIVKAQALSDGVIFNVKVRGKFYNYKVWIFNFTMYVFQWAYNKLGEERYKKIYG